MSIVIIPAYNPDKKLIEVIQEIKNYKINKVIVVNDGSNKESNYIFNKIKEEVILLEHDKNYGKGKAISEDTELGYIAIEGGTINITTEADGIQAETVLNISSDSKINITTNGKITSSNNNQEFGGGFKGGFYSSSSTASEEDSQSSKGLKAGTEITIESGNIEINSTDDSIHSNGIILINNGTIKTSSGDDGIHADTNVVINNGNITVSKSYEGLESSYIEINGGTISIVASDDGINVAGGNDSSAMGGRPGENNFSSVQDSNRKLVINNGNLTVNATGDGLYSNYRNKVKKI